MKITQPYAVRFVPAALVPALLDCWRMTSVGHKPDPRATPAGVDPHSRYGRLLRATYAFEQAHPGIRGVYKDLDGLTSTNF